MSHYQFAVMIAGIAKSGMEDYVKHYLTEMMNRSRKDEGCLAYNIHQSTDNPNEFMVYMLWRDEADFNRHNAKPDMQEFKKELAKQIFEIQSPKTYWHLLDHEE